MSEIPDGIPANFEEPTPTVSEARTIDIVMGPHSPLRCSDCGDAEAPTYVVKRRRGLYALLCFKGGKGCYERSGRTLCQYINAQAQCMNLAEYQVMENNEAVAITCCVHLSLMLPTGSDKIEVFPLD